MSQKGTLFSLFQNFEKIEKSELNNFFEPVLANIVP